MTDSVGSVFIVFSLKPNCAGLCLLNGDSDSGTNQWRKHDKVKVRAKDEERFAAVGLGRVISQTIGLLFNAKIF